MWGQQAPCSPAHQYKLSLGHWAADLQLIPPTTLTLLLLALPLSNTSISWFQGSSTRANSSISASVALEKKLLVSPAPACVSYDELALRGLPCRHRDSLWVTADFTMAGTSKEVLLLGCRK